MLLTPAQTQIAVDTHRFRVVCCGRRFGKALALDTPILTTRGYKNLIDICVGDYVFNEKGDPTEVLYKSDIYLNRKCYAVRFSDGSTIIADENHDWMVEDKSYRKNLVRSGNVKRIKRTTGEIARTLRYNDHENNYSIQLAGKIKHNEKVLPIEPYFMGLWLGDGHTLASGITTVDKEIIDYLSDYAKRLDCTVRESSGTGSAKSYFIHGDKTQKSRGSSLQAKLRNLSLLGCKHIPEIYMLGSIEQRLELLNGLMDSDGYAGKLTNEYCSISQRLANDVQKLLASLSIKSTVKEYDATLYGRVVGKRYRVHFNTREKVFRLRRKVQRTVSNRQWINRKYIISADEIESVPVQCLMVDSPSHLFLAGYTLTPTHNTMLAVEEIKGKLLSKDVRVCYLATTYQQARDIAWEILKHELHSIVVDSNEQRLELKVKNQNGGTSTVILRGWESVDTLRGQKFDFLVLDEVSSYRNFFTNWHEVLRPTLTDTKGECLFISTPKGFNHFYELYQLETSDKDYKSFHFTSYDNPYLPVEELDKAKQELNEDRFGQEYLADFRKTSGLVYKEFDRAVHLYDPAETKIINPVETIAGIDWGYTNPAAICPLVRDYDNHYWIPWEYYKTGKTDAEVAEYAASANLNKVYPDPENPSAILELRKRGVNVMEVIKNKDSIINGISKVRDLLRAKRLHISKHCENLIWEFETYSYDDNAGKERQNENPLDENNHLLDACRYPVMMISDGQRREAIQYYPGHVVTANKKGYATQYIPRR